MTSLTPLGDDALDELVTLRDWLRVAVSRFRAAGLFFGHGTATALDEAAFLILHTLHLPIDELEPYVDARLTRRERVAVRDMIEKRILTRKPAPYLTSSAWIRGHEFYVDERVIVPRSFIGELLCDGLEGLVADPSGIGRVLDLCTGSGCLAILSALAFPNAVVDAVDISAEALAVASRNVTEYGLENRITLHEGDLFSPLSGQAYDLIVTNPPYVDAAGMAELPPEFQHEPRIALAAGVDGLDVVARIVRGSLDHLTASGAVLAEIGRCRPAFEAAFPGLDPLWLETETSSDEVLWMTADVLARGTSQGLSAKASRARKSNRGRR